jgi:hypothetical protein
MTVPETTPLTVRDQFAMAEPDVQIRCIGGNCPVQAEGTINGEPFYFRARGEHWSIEVEGGFVLEDAEKGIPRHGFYMEREYGDGPYDAGWMPVDEARGFITEAAEHYTRWKADAMLAQRALGEGEGG